MSAVAYKAGQNSLRYYFAKHHGISARAGVTLLLMCKENALTGMALLRRRRQDAGFHVQMLANLFTPVRVRP
jgi:hypothetical protein